MDPDATLARIRDLAVQVADKPWLVQQLAEAFLDLDHWLHSGGFLPTAWQQT